MVTEANWTSWSVDDLIPYVRRVMDWFGSGRLMFGSDWPVCLLAGGYGEVKRATEAALGGVSTGDRERIFGATAADVYRIDAR
jgi:L-fuconolactonase